jgi:DNA invertase Pin-like site-specific DNA recombinase/predicted transcriptional regulator
MIEDAKKGKIHTILVKDLSRLGRDYIGVGDYLEQIFPVLGVRFIALNSRYDSNKYSDRTMGLDMAVSNLINSFYSKDLSKKRKAALHTKWKQGKSTAGRLPYGYVKDKTAKGGWKIDPEAAEVVKLIFDKANDGWSTRQIMEYLNEQGIVTPGVYREQHQRYSRMRKVPDAESLWDMGKVRVILSRYEYTGAFVQHYRQSVQVGSNMTMAVPEGERYITENAHDAIVTREEYENAKAVIQTVEKVKYRVSNQYALKGKIRCGVCRLVMSYREQAQGPMIYCSHKTQAGRHSRCYSDAIPAGQIDAIILSALREQLKALQDLGIRIEEKQESSSPEMDFRKMETEIEVMKAERIRQYEAYAEGLITKEAYLSRKEELTGKIEERNRAIERIRAVVESDNALNSEIACFNRKAEKVAGQSRLTKEIADAFIDMVYVYDPKTVEVQFKFDDLLHKAEERYGIGKDE